ncbi:MAG TPA: biotin/lipoyl-containing protein [Candidatus Sulfotelmatobacter sp.]|nr:biotin/lipoyl-containing protein [Candidatus Sulfotelmatobacter sp.]
MKYEVRIAGKTRGIELHRDGARWQVALDGAETNADAAEIAPGIFSILLDGVSHEVRVAPNSDGTLTLQDGPNEFKAEVSDPRAWRGRKHGAIEAEGRQQIVAPMPGKVIRLLVKPGDKVEAGQGLLVVEAMKMQNEVKSPKTGTVEKLSAKEGQAVNAGDVLAWID